MTFGTGSGPAAGAEAVLTQTGAYGTTASVVCTGINSATQALGPFCTLSGSTLTVNLVSAPSASQANTVYGVNYNVQTGG